MVFDAIAKLGGHSFARTTLSLTGTFKDGDRIIDTVTGSGSAKIPYPAVNCGFSKAARAAFAEFNENLRTAPGLIAYLSEKPKMPEDVQATTTNNNSSSASAPLAEPAQNAVSQSDAAAPNSVAPHTTGQEGNSVYTLLPSIPTTNSPTANPVPNGNR